MGFIDWLKSIFAAKPTTPASPPTPAADQSAPAPTAAPTAEPGEVRFQEISRILVYRQGSQERLDNQLAYLRALNEAGLMPGLSFYLLEKTAPGATYDYLLIETGSATAFTRPLHLAVKEEILLRTLPGKKWEDLWADEVILDLPDVSESSACGAILSRLKEEIRQRLYKVKEVIGLY